MDWHDRLSASSNCGFNPVGIEVISARIDIDEDRSGARAGNAPGSGEEGEGSSDYFVSRPDA
jgi:hypothetical protein